LTEIYDGTKVQRLLRSII